LEIVVKILSLVFPATLHDTETAPLVWAAKEAGS
jgi:hypothetical protein